MQPAPKTSREWISDLISTAVLRISLSSWACKTRSFSLGSSPVTSDSPDANCSIFKEPLRVFNSLAADWTDWGRIKPPIT